MKIADHYEKFKRNNAKMRFEKLKIFYHANMMLRYQESKIIEKLKVDKAVLKKLMAKEKEDRSRFRKAPADLNELMRLKLENDRFREKIFALDKALLNVG